MLDHMVGIKTDENGSIAHLETKSHGALAGDLFVDCTGMQSLLLGQHYGVGFRSQKHVLFNDTALALQIPYPDESTAIASQTIGTAQSNGWIWDIGLPHGAASAMCIRARTPQTRRPSASCGTTCRAPGGPREVGSPAQADFQSGLSRKILAPETA
jgi:hypothetical protein